MTSEEAKIISEARDQFYLSQRLAREGLIAEMSERMNVPKEEVLRIWEQKL